MLRVLRSLQRKAFNYAYLFTPPWDLAVPAPEIVRFVSERTPGKAIDVGCGTGTNLLYLAQHNWTVTGIDFALSAIKKADRKLKDYSRTLLVADAARLSELHLPGPYDLALDMGCLHGLSEIDRVPYIKGLEKWTRPNGVCMVFSFRPSARFDFRGLGRPRGISKDEMTDYFKNGFELTNYEQGERRPSAWYYLRRKSGVWGLNHNCAHPGSTKTVRPDAS